MGESTNTPRELSLGRKLLFSGVVPVGVFGALELALALAGVQPKDSSAPPTFKEPRSKRSQPLQKVESREGRRVASSR